MKPENPAKNTLPMDEEDRETFDRLMQLDLDDSNSATACRANVAALMKGNKDGFLAALAEIDVETRACLQQYVTEIEKDEAGGPLTMEEQGVFDTLISEIERHSNYERPEEIDDDAEGETEDELQERFFQLIQRNSAGCRKAIGELDADRKALMIPDPDEVLREYDEGKGIIAEREKF